MEPRRDPKRITRRRLIGGAAAALAAYVGGGLIGSELQVERRTLHLPKWDANGFRVVQISDVHVNDDALTAAAQRAVRIAVAERPDLIVFTGDFVNYADPERLANITRAFEGLADAACPCLGIMGNHDYWCKDPEGVLAAAAKTRLKMLRNETVEVAGVSVVGLDDALKKLHRPDVVRGQGLSKSRLVLLHEPDYVVQVPDEASLVLSGHSHGGEICLPGGIPLYTPVGSKKYTGGYYGRSAVPLYVNRGTATLAPRRLYCPPEVAVLTLTSQEG